MLYNFYEVNDNRSLITSIFTISIFTTPFESVIIPTGAPSISYIFTDEKQMLIHKKNEFKFHKLIVSGQFDSSYTYRVNSKGYNIGINLHPTALYKILNSNISSLKNKHLHFKYLDKELTNKLNAIFIKNKNNIPSFIANIKVFFENLEIKETKNTAQIDIAINYILDKEGMIQVNDLLKIVSFSQKSLETKFKKIIGLTPGKYIRLIRFLKLMRKYESKEISINDLIYMYNYYDHSHFIKDFKLFMSESPKSYFKKEYPLIKAYSKKL